jgi:hypothetical protein
VGSATRAIVGTASIGATAAGVAAERRPRELAELVATAAIGSGGIAGAAIECGVTAGTTDATAAAELADVQVGEGLELAALGLSAEVISQRANVRALRSFVS